MAPHHSLPSSSPLATCPPPTGCQTSLRKRHLASDSVRHAARAVLFISLASLLCYSFHLCRSFVIHFTCVAPLCLSLSPLAASSQMLTWSGTATLLQSPEGERSPQSVVGDVFAESLQSNDTSARFAALKLSCAVEFEEHFHEPLLRELWHSAFPHIPFERISTRWEELGFQSVEPTKDLRGAGVTGLSHLLHFCSSSGNLEMVRRGNSQFPLAVASLNVTLILCAHLNLLSLPSSGACKIARCSESTLRNFMRLHDSCAKNTRPDGRLTTSSTCLDLIHEQSLRCARACSRTLCVRPIID